MHLINPYMPVIIPTAHGSIESALEATKRGAFIFLNKPFVPEKWFLRIERAIEKQKLASRGKGLQVV